MEPTLEQACDDLRGDILAIGDKVESLMRHSDIDSSNTEAVTCRHGECKANVMLSYRHLEDARMRLGKVMQELQGGVSCYDRHTE